MLSDLKINIEKQEGINFNMGSIMQGVLMEHIDTEYAQLLHNLVVNPYSQYITYGKGNTVEWHIKTLTKEAEINIIKPLMCNIGNSIEIKHKGIKLTIINKGIEKMTEDELMSSTYFAECSPYINISFITPTAFKSSGKYQFYPTVQHIFQSLINKYDACSGDAPIYSSEFMNEINNNVSIIGYNLRSTMYHLEGIRIPAFKGNITLKVKGSQMFKNLMHMLVQFGEYSGIGIKTAMGMGAMKMRKDS